MSCFFLLYTIVIIYIFVKKIVMRKKSNSKPMFKKSIYEDLEEKGTSLILLRFI